MPLTFRGIRAHHADVRLTLDTSFPDGIVVGVTGPAPAQLELFAEVAAGIVPPDEGAVESDSFFFAASTFYLPEFDRIQRSLQGAFASSARTIAVGPGLSLTPEWFLQSVREEFQRLRADGRLVLLVSQHLELLERWCDEVAVLEDGAIANRGNPAAVLPEYRTSVCAQLRNEAPRSQLQAQYLRRGDGRARLEELELRGKDGQSAARLQSGEAASIYLRVRFEEPVADPVIGILIRNRIGVTVYGTNTELEHISLGPREAGDTLELQFDFDCDLCPHEYSLTAASHDPDGTAHDWLDEALLFTVIDSRPTEGVANLRARVKVKGA